MSELETLDTRGLLCPLPVIRTQDFIKKRKSQGAHAGAQLLVVASDPGALHDIPAWCRIHGHRVLRAEQVQDDPGGSQQTYGQDIQVLIEIGDDG